jgi:hypothetical protein
MLLLLPAGAGALVRGRSVAGIRIGPRATALVIVAFSLSPALLLGGRGTRNAELNIRIPESERPLYEFLSGLPPDVLIAGWPGHAIDNVPYISARRILMSFETHLPFHEAYVRELRRRMTLLTDAYFATDVSPVLRLRDELGVTHLIVD